MLLKNKSLLTIGVICLVIFIGISAYLWYLYFQDYEGKVIAQDEGLEFMRSVEFENSGPIYYVNASVDDDDKVIPKYYFRVKNSAKKDYEYNLYLEDSEGKDGCSSGTRFKRSDLQYELKLDNKVVKSGGLDTLENNLLDSRKVSKDSINDYSLKVWLKDDYVGKEQLHYHYIVTLKEKK